MLMKTSFFKINIKEEFLMKKLAFLLIMTVLVLYFSSCDTFTPFTDSTSDGSDGGQTAFDTTNTVHEVYYGYYDDLWLSVGVGGKPWLENIADRQEPVGQEFEVMCTFMHEDMNYTPQDYEFLFTVSDPAVAEITKKNVMNGGAVNKVWLKGLKPGEIRLEFKMVHKETGGMYATYVDVTIIPAEKGT